MKKDKIKMWFDEHKEGIKSEVIKASCYVFGFGVGYFCSKIIFTLRGSVGITAAHDAGIIKFFDPSNGNEVGLEEACECLKRRFES